MGLDKTHKHGGTGDGLILCFLHQRGHGCGPGPAWHASKQLSCSTCLSRLEDLFLAEVLGTVKFLTLQQRAGRRGRADGGWHHDADGTKAPWPQTRSATFLGVSSV